MILFGSALTTRLFSVVPTYSQLPVSDDYTTTRTGILGHNASNKLLSWRSPIYSPYLANVEMREIKNADDYAAMSVQRNAW